MNLRSIAGAAALALLSSFGATAARAGTAQVSFVHPERFVDAGNTDAERDANLRVLSTELQALAARLLPADQSLSVEVLEVDLAGDSRPTQRGKVRIGRDDGRDPARITLRYTLSGGGQVLRSTEAKLDDFGTPRGLAAARPDGPLAAERALLGRWFQQEFAATPPSAG